MPISSRPHRAAATRAAATRAAATRAAAICVAGLCLLAVIPTPINVQAQEPGAAGAAGGERAAGVERSPEEVARLALDAIDDMRWDDVVDLMHPDALDRIRERELYELRLEQRMRRSPPPASRDGDMPEAVWRWFEEQARQAQERWGPRVERVYGLESVDQLEALPAREFLVRWLDANDMRREMVRQMDMHQPERLHHLDMAEALRVERHVIGSVLEGDSLALVLYRQGSAGHATMVTDRIEVPVSAFAALVEIMQQWAYWPGLDDGDR